MSRPMTINFCNKSTKVNSTQFSQILLALSTYASNVTADWNLAPVNIVSVPNASLSSPANNTIFLFDNADQAGALGYHYEYKGLAVGEVFAKTILDYAGSTAILYKNPTTPTVSSVMCHEFFEMLGNPIANKWWMDNNGTLWAAELCDPVQNNIYTVTIAGGVKVAMSDYILPLWSVPDATHSMGNFNKMNTLTTPFTIKNGYGITLQGEYLVIEYGEGFPEEFKSKAETDRQEIAEKFGLKTK